MKVFSDPKVVEGAIKSLMLHSGDLNAWPDNILAIFGLEYQRSDNKESDELAFWTKAAVSVSEFLDSLLAKTGSMVVIREICVEKDEPVPRTPAMLFLGEHWSWTSDRELGDPCGTSGKDEVYWWITGVAESKDITPQSARDAVYINTKDPFGYEREIDIGGPILIARIDVGTSHSSKTYERFTKETEHLGDALKKKIMIDFGVKKLVYDEEV